MQCDTWLASIKDALTVIDLLPIPVLLEEYTHFGPLQELKTRLSNRSLRSKITPHSICLTGMGKGAGPSPSSSQEAESGTVGQGQGLLRGTPCLWPALLTCGGEALQCFPHYYIVTFSQETGERLCMAPSVCHLILCVPNSQRQTAVLQPPPRMMRTQSESLPTPDGLMPAWTKREILNINNLYKMAHTKNKKQ